MLLYVKGVKRELCDQIRTISDRKPRAQARQTLTYGQSDFFIQEHQKNLASLNSMLIKKS